MQPNLKTTYDGIICKLYTHPETIDIKPLQKFIIKPKNSNPLVVKFQLGDDIPIRIEVTAIGDQVNCSFDFIQKYNYQLQTELAYTWNRNPFVDEFQETGMFTIYIKFVTDQFQVLDRFGRPVTGLSFGYQKMKTVVGPHHLYLLQPYDMDKSGDLVPQFDVIWPKDLSKTVENMEIKPIIPIKYKKSNKALIFFIFIIIIIAVIIGIIIVDKHVPNVLGTK